MRLEDIPTQTSFKKHVTHSRSCRNEMLYKSFAQIGNFEDSSLFTDSNLQMKMLLWT